MHVLAATVYCGALTQEYNSSAFPGTKQKKTLTENFFFVSLGYLKL